MPAEPQPKPRPAPYPKRSPARRRFSALDAVMARDAAWEEGKHPRASNGQFGKGETAHIITTSDGETTTFHHVGTSKPDAVGAHAEVDEDEHGEAEYHVPKVKGRGGDRSDTLHIVHSQDAAGGTSVHGAHLDYGSARNMAHDASAAEWEENGPRRSEAGLTDLEAAGLAQTWNEDHAGDHDGVTVKVDDIGDPILDDEGGFQFVQDGVDVEPTEDMVAAFDELREDEYPEDDAAAYPGLEEANKYFADEGRHESVFNIHSHRPGGQDAAPQILKGQTMNPREMEQVLLYLVDKLDPQSKAEVGEILGRDVTDMAADAMAQGGRAWDRLPKRLKERAAMALKKKDPAAVAQDAKPAAPSFPHAKRLKV